jgi:hypothetical protein
MTIVTIILNINKYILNPIIAFSIALAVLWIIWGGVMVLIAQQNGNTEGSARYRRHMLYGLLGLFIMSSVFGIMELFTSWVRTAATAVTGT